MGLMAVAYIYKSSTISFLTKMKSKTIPQVENTYKLK